DGLFAARRPFWAWQSGCGLYVGSMFVLGTLEGTDPGLLFRGDAAATWLYGLRWIAGAAMLGASWAWLARARAASVCRQAPPVPSEAAEIPYEEAA
ncbi:MAG: hypothetical protein KDD11_15005, partial [Acidobacteria bacterium]|nr:hypothetical protein [Acidobacteriota bacterium]